MEGVVRAPSEFSMTFGVPASMIATQLLVVPRSMPMILAIALPFRLPGLLSYAVNGVFVPRFKRKRPALARLGAAFPGLFASFRHRDQCRPQYPVVKQVALLEHLHDRARRLVRLDHGHRLMFMRVELGPDGGIDL